MLSRTGCGQTNDWWQHMERGGEHWPAAMVTIRTVTSLSENYSSAGCWHDLPEDPLWDWEAVWDSGWRGMYTALKAPITYGVHLPLLHSLLLLQTLFCGTLIYSALHRWSIWLCLKLNRLLKFVSSNKSWPFTIRQCMIQNSLWFVMFYLS